MATNTAGTVARQYQTHQVHYLRKEFTFADAGVRLTVGTIPAGAVIHKAMSGVDVDIAFTAGTNKQLDVGKLSPVDDDDFWGTDLSLASIAFVPLDEAVSFKVAADTVVTCTPDLTGSGNTAGSATVVIAYTVKDGV